MYFVAVEDSGTLFFFAFSAGKIRHMLQYRLTGDSCLHCKKSASRGMSLHGKPPPPCLGGKRKTQKNIWDTT